MNNVYRITVEKREDNGDAFHFVPVMMDTIRNIDKPDNFETKIREWFKELA